MGLRRVKVVISDAHEGLKAAITKVLSAIWQRCRVHFMRNALSDAGKTQKRIVSAWVGTTFAQNGAAAARKPWRDVDNQMRPRLPQLAGLLDEAEADVLAHMVFPAHHRAKIHYTNPLKRLNGEIKRRADVVGMFPNEPAATRFIGALLLQQKDEGATQRARYMTLETIVQMSDTPLVFAKQPWNRFSSYGKIDEWARSSRQGNRPSDNQGDLFAGLGRPATLPATLETSATPNLEEPDNAELAAVMIVASLAAAHGPISTAGRNNRCSWLGCGSAVASSLAVLRKCSPVCTVRLAMHWLCSITHVP